jgi:hypothetical protein
VSGDPCPVVKYEWLIQRLDGMGDCVVRIKKKDLISYLCCLIYLDRDFMTVPSHSVFYLSLILFEA